MENPNHEEIMQRAYDLWEQAGKPEGREDEFYYQAEQEVGSAAQSPPLQPDIL